MNMMISVPAVKVINKNNVIALYCLSQAMVIVLGLLFAIAAAILESAT